MTAQTIALNRFGLGGRLDEAPPVNPRAWLLSQAAGPAPLQRELHGLPDSQDILQTMQQRRRTQRQARGVTGGHVHDELRRLNDKIRGYHLDQIGRRILLATRTAAPFRERLVHFWANHFAVSTNKRPVLGLAGAHEFEAIRPYVDGSFATLLKSAVLHPAMLLYLDQFISVGPRSAVGKGSRSRRGLNENLAREILELHTLGVDGGYTQDDVVELARALTGWTVPRIASDDEEAGSEARFNPQWHEPGNRRVLGKHYPDGGAELAHAILDSLARHPSTARFVAIKLARHFAADDPPEKLVTALERAFLESDGDLPTVYRALVLAPEPWEQVFAKYRSPWDWIIAAERASPPRSEDEALKPGLIDQLGQPVWSPSSPAGWGDTVQAWAAPDGLLKRVELAPRLAQRAAQIDVEQEVGNLFPGALSESTARGLAGAESAVQAFALLLSSPEMMRR